MCKVSDKLKLCTCKTKDVSKLKHYWILKRPNANIDEILGQAILPANIGKKADDFNSKTILHQLNEGNCFDVELDIQHNDILELHFTFNADPNKFFMPSCFGNYLAYSFRYKKDKWKQHEFNPFSDEEDDIKNGKIVHPF